MSADRSRPPARKRRSRGTRTGFTTGACSAAAARAAARGLATGAIPGAVVCELPNGDAVSFAVAERELGDGWARAVVVKDAGDDPDVTHKARLTADLRLLPDEPGAVRLAGGEGVGQVTRPGLGLPIGEPAINPVPRRNIEHNVRAGAGDLLERAGLAVKISVPGGAALARRTLNPRLGIIGGVSILGTTGIVRPFSTAAYRDSVIQNIEAAAAQGQTAVVLTTGGRTERCAMSRLPDLDPVCFVKMGDFVRHALETVVRVGVEKVIVAGMVGKLAKIAQGETVTHAGRNPVDMDLVAGIAQAAGAPAALCAEIRQAETARFASERMAELGLEEAFHRELVRRVADNLQSRHPGRYAVRVLMCGFEGEYLTEAAGERRAS